ncbi:hypothetical protein E5676_scaffold1428G00130 [Cucumis melo var. makuwa]|uniref:Uncharacterized protein n=1 Tax=Cucumis melo var. makuwa TaxID=1194695 RepID=A0A5A7UPE0_CUCMM|nr:hypothetical protein E6C27_scaffold80G002730 [Cucumis melo var. makuwa]TYK22310.1 hypothetical protein E5676_scaffold1428G00130 [Cucumis melo var. makuwa]
MFLHIRVQNFHEGSFKCKTEDFTNAPPTLRIAMLLFRVQDRRFHRCILIFKLKGFINTSSYSSLNMLHLCLLIFKLEGFIETFSYLNSKVLSSKSQKKTFIIASQANLKTLGFIDTDAALSSLKKRRCKNNSTSSPICCSLERTTMAQLCLCLSKMTSKVQLSLPFYKMTMMVQLCLSLSKTSDCSTRKLDPTANARSSPNKSWIADSEAAQRCLIAPTRAVDLMKNT